MDARHLFTPAVPNPSGSHDFITFRAALAEWWGQNTLRDVAAMRGRFEPAARIEMERVDIGNGR